LSHCKETLEFLRQRGYRITSQRAKIIEMLMHSPNHIAAEVLYGRVQEQAPDVNIATIYRTLDMLVAEGLANRTTLLDGQFSYAPAIHGAHLHLVCRYCQRSLPVDEKILATASQYFLEQYGFTVDFHHLTLFGVCDACQATHPLIAKED
jgi:Fur family ferric uptake transcriptional regulator